jgi:hypothetical protein
MQSLHLLDRTARCSVQRSGWLDGGAFASAKHSAVTRCPGRLSRVQVGRWWLRRALWGVRTA